MHNLPILYFTLKAFSFLFTCESRVHRSLNFNDNVNNGRVKNEMKPHRENQIKEDDTVINGLPLYTRGHGYLDCRHHSTLNYQVVTDLKMLVLF